jgi:hypothetical protein
LRNATFVIRRQPATRGASPGPKLDGSTVSEGKLAQSESLSQGFFSGYDGPGTRGQASVLNTPLNWGVNQGPIMLAGKARARANCLGASYKCGCARRRKFLGWMNHS